MEEADRGEIGVSASPIIGPRMPGNEKGEAPIGCPPTVREVKLSFVILYRSNIIINYCVE